MSTQAESRAVNEVIGSPEVSSAAVRPFNIWSAHSARLGLLVVMVFAVYFRTTQFSFVNYDDPQYVYENPHVITGLSWANLAWAFSTLNNDVSYWHPLTWLAHQADCQLFGLLPGAHHLTSIWIHVANTLLVFAVLGTLRLGTWTRFLVAGLFAVHPLHVESVAWVAERKDVLYSFFWLAALYSYLRFRERREFAWYGAALLAFVCSLMAKPTAVTLPIVLLLVELVHSTYARHSVSWLNAFGSGKHGWLAGRAMILAPFFLLSLASGILTLVAQSSLGTLQSLTQLPLPDRLDNAWIAYASYVRKAILPLNLCVSYVQTTNPSSWAVFGALALLLGVTWGAYRLRSRCPLILFGWLWFILSLLPNIGLIQAGPQSMADRYSYLPVLGIFLMMAGLGRELALRWNLRPLFSGLGMAVLVACSILSFRQLDSWKDGVALFSRAVAMNPDNWVARLGLGAALTQQQRFDDALPHLRRALELPGNNEEAHLKLASCLYWKHDSAGALSHLASVLQLYPSSIEALFLMADILSSDPSPSVRSGQRAVALVEQAAARNRSLSPNDWLIRSAAFAEAGQFQTALDCAERAAELASAMRNPILLHGIKERIALYRAGQAFHRPSDPVSTVASWPN